MPTQLSFAFPTKPISQHPPPLWLEVDVNAKVSIALHDALTPLSTEEDGDYEQRIYDALWLARFELSLDYRESANFTFSFPRKHWRTEETTDISVRMRCEAHGETIRLGLLADFQEATWPTTWAGAHRAI